MCACVRACFRERRGFGVEGSLPLLDYTIHAGLKFWKQPRRKLFAVTKSDLKRKGKSKKRPYSLCEFDEDEGLSKRPCHDDQLLSDLSFSIEDLKADIELIDSKVEKFSDSLNGVKKSLEEILTYSREVEVPFWLKRIICQSFECKMCLKVPIRPLVIKSKCCKTVLGCEVCVNGWYSGSEALTKHCPACRAERGYSETMLLRGLDSFLIEAKAMMQDNDSTELDWLGCLSHIILVF